MKDNIYIKIENEYLDLADNISVQFVWNSPLFDTELLKGSYTYPFNISLNTNKNRRLLKRPDDVKNYNKMQQRIACTLGLFGKEYNAYLKIIDASRKDNASVAVIIKDSALIESKDKSIRTFDYGTADMRITDQYKNCMFFFTQPEALGGITSMGRAYVSINGYTYHAGQADPQWRNLSDAEQTAAYNSLISQINADTANNKVTAALSSYVGLETMTLTAAIPGKMAPFVFTKGYATEPNNDVYAAFISMDYLGSGSEVATFMNETIFGTNDEKRLTFSPLFFDNFYADEDLVFDNQANNFYYDSNTFKTNDYLHPTRYSVIPLVYLNHVISCIFKGVNYRPFGDFLKDPELATIVFFNTQTIDYKMQESHQVSVVIPPYGGVQRLINYDVNVFKEIITLYEHLPNITLSQFLSLLRNTLGCYFIFDTSNQTVDIGMLDHVISEFKKINWEGKSLLQEKVLSEEFEGVTFKYSNDSSDASLTNNIKSLEGFVIKEPVATFEDLPTIGNVSNDLRLVQADNSFYKAVFVDNYGTVTWNWEFYSANLFDYVYATSTSEIVSGNSVHLMTNYNNLPYNLPYFDQKAISAPYNQGEINFTPRLMFYRGVKTFEKDGDTYNYPVIDRIAAADEKYSMQWDSEKGLVNSFFKKWIDFRINARPVEKVLALKKSDLNDIRWDYFSVIEKVPYLIENLSFNVGKKTLSNTTAKLHSK